MGRWTPLMLMGGGLAILLGTLLGINFPIGGQQVANNDSPDGRTSKVLPANINVNSSSPSRSTSNDTASESRGRVAQDNFSTPDDRSTIAQSNDSSSTSDTTPGTSTGVQSDRMNQDRQPIRALW
ncbi:MULTISPECIES: hypothetical protein [Cyanophyceae]|uniref:Uncharacterized protein n=1 Tax=Nodularia spumigena CENA596 TaxID=1819295 RepID=A0A166J6J7_NODSP|nr:MULTISPECIES: hypothetical protein [Cyanophyceae]MDB9354727.1 hypothetical protein [Nodularia spumigena CS-587/03]KZL49291.1 hypothetical protein A2T98_13545 [Nodularia spumigena CENA596]MDB9302883.1 hypothetical protein [Nodularia spumigena CS-591/12]MDB9317670.1 hypothetical protein [Nodularia spumigena CS-590/01A]MDB9322318.1 hypothetical protein [Nodularia spumigena CS-591/07A]